MLTAYNWAFNQNVQKWASGTFIATCRNSAGKLTVYNYKTTVVGSGGVFFTPGQLILYLRLADRRSLLSTVTQHLSEFVTAVNRPWLSSLSISCAKQY